VIRKQLLRVRGPTSLSSAECFSRLHLLLYIASALQRAATFFFVSILLRSFPVELFDEIIQSTTRADHLSISTVSKFFNSLATRALYHSITVDSTKSVFQCCRTLLANKNAAQAVRVFLLEPDDIWVLQSPFNLTRHPYTTILAADLNPTSLSRSINYSDPLSRTTNLFNSPRNLWFFSKHPRLSKRLFFPPPQNLQFSSPLDPSLASFLARHRTLRELHLPLDRRCLTIV